jgi:hypothetical protein
VRGVVSRRAFVKAAGAATALATGSGALARNVPLHLIDGRLDKQPWPQGSLRLDNVMRQWRDGLCNCVADHGAIALVRWDMALMLRQLGREQRLAVRVRPREGGVFEVMLAPQAPGIRAV